MGTTKLYKDWYEPKEGNKVLELGAGFDYYKSDKNIEIIHLDRVKLEHTEIVWDLNKYPWPFENNTFDFVRVKTVIEHLNDVKTAMEEIYRILKPGGFVEIWAPHFASMGAHTDITHKKEGFGYYSFQYFEPEYAYNYYSTARFKCIKRAIVYPHYFELIEWIANKMPRLHEIWLHKFFPVRTVHFLLKCIKKE